MKAYITKYALTSGISEKEVEVCADVNGNMVQVVTNHYPEYYHKPFWYTDKQEAIDHAETMRIKKIASLEKSIKKLKNLKF